MVQAPSLRQMLEAGVHFGHRTSRWNPNMAPYIFTSKSGVHVINLESTAAKMEEAMKFLAGLASEGKTVIFVGTKKQAASIVKEAAIACGMPYVNCRWLGGTLTNFDVFKASVKKFEQKKELIESPKFAELTKREQTMLREEVAKGERVFGGLVKLEKRPDALILIGAHDEKNALSEGKLVGIPIVAITDTNVNPTLIDYPVPANDDATKSIKLFADVFSKVIKENKAVAKKEEK